MMKMIMKKNLLYFAMFALGAVLASCKAELENPPIITSASYQHTLYNGMPQPIEAKAAKDAAPFVITYYHSEDALSRNEGGFTEPPTEIGTYYVKIERPAGKGYKEGKPVKVEYRIQKPLAPVNKN
jgi:hypothetical protein